MEMFFVIGGIVVFVGGIIMIANHFEKKRREAVANFAMNAGYMIDPDITSFTSQVSGFKLFTQGHSRKAKNLFRGKNGDDEFAVCDYQYTTGSGKNSQTHLQTVCVIRSSRLQLPHFFARRQIALFDFLGKVFGGQDINFDHDPAFSKAFVLQTAGVEEECRQLFDDNVRQHFTQLGPKGIQVESKGEMVVFHCGRQMKIEKMQELIDDALSVRRLFGKR